MLVFGAIAPHGGDILEEIADDASIMAQTRAAMLELGRRCALARPDTIVVLTPHGAILKGAVSIGYAPKAFGELGKKPRAISATFETNLPLAESIQQEMAARSLPVVPIPVKSSRRSKETSIVPLDWGALIPLWYCARPLSPTPQVVVMAPDRRLMRETLVRTGVAIARAASASGKRVALIASCDQGHAHAVDGPYGYSPASARHDEAMCAAIAENDLPRLLEWPESFLSEAKVDAYWQTIILAGALAHTPMQGELLSYEAPTYFGMAIAAYEPVTR